MTQDKHLEVNALQHRLGSFRRACKIAGQPTIPAFPGLSQKSSSLTPAAQAMQSDLRALQQDLGGHSTMAVMTAHSPSQDARVEWCLEPSGHSTGP